jgi:ribosomal protein S18 acetylase RimI-like enzyme
MEIRQANVDDAPGIRAVALESLLATYDFLDDETIRTAVDSWYDVDELRERIADGEELYLVAAEGHDEESRDVVGFSQSGLLEEDVVVGEIRWLHVHPDSRGQGYADKLLSHTQETLRTEGVSLFRGVVLAENREGNEFWAHHGFERAGIQEVTIDGTVYAENIYESGMATGAPRLESGEATTPEGQTVFVAFDEGQQGSHAAFYPVYTDREHDELYGWYCGGCDGFEVAMDTMERLQCNECPNSRKASRWDAAYL